MADPFAPRDVTTASEAFSEHFANRVSESDAFRQAVRRHEDRLTASATGFEQARRNVLAFHGVGGMGKTELSRRLEDWLVRGRVTAGWGSPPATNRPLVVSRIDRTSRPGFDPEEAVLAIRADAAVLGVRYQAFDLALATYWLLAHPSQALPDVSARRSVPRRVAEHLGLAEEIESAVSGVIGEILGEAAGGRITTRAAKAILKAMHEDRKATAAIGGNPYLSDTLQSVIESPQPETLVDCLGLLTTDLRQAPPERRPLWVVFVDEFERINGLDNRSDEATFQRAVMCMPDALWVITGRNRLDWAEDDRRRSLRHAGAAVWPLLAGARDEPRQHRVGDLSERDVRAYLESVRRSSSRQMYTDEGLDRIVAEAKGWPLYLDLAVDTAYRLSTAEAPAPADELGEPLPVLVERLMRDLSSTERQVLRAACHLATFDADLLGAAVRLDGVAGATARLERRGIIRHADDTVLGLRVHDSLRRAVADADRTLEDSWAPEDARRVAERVSDRLAERHAKEDDPARRLRLFAAGFQLALDHELEVAWLVSAATDQPYMAIPARALPPLPAEQQETWAGRFHRLLACWIPTDTDAARLSRLEALVAHGLPDDLERVALRFSAYNLRGNGQPERALAIFDRLAADPEEAPGLIQYQRGLCLVRLGRFPEAATAVERVRAVDPQDVTRAERLEGTIHQWHGRLRDAVLAAQRRAEALERTGQHRVALENRSNESRQRALIDMGEQATAEDRAERMREIDRGSLVRSFLCAACLAAAGHPDRFPPAFAALRRSFTDDDMKLTGWKVQLPLAFDAAVRADNGGMRDAQTAMMTSRSGKVSLWTVVVAMWARLLDADVPDPVVRPQWLEAAEDVEARWHAVLLDRRRDVGRQRSR